MSTQIADEFTDLNVSRQRKYQLRKAKAGRCAECGRELATALYCKACAAKMRIKNREWARQNLGCVRRNLRAKSYRDGGQP